MPTKLWFVAGSWTMVAMYVAWTINCVYGWYNWSKLNKEQKKVCQVESSGV